ncbi:hypothetical protein MB27_01810 [Actinoplanes utahensis]|uniref:Glycerophosphoryl diester phosphodiesterase membrane domain-containing protein n=1 Tax=Actinoplanes utahensis TaxID=1869 RepID=A0A0A6UU27_ACTUT|nr:hypothetical protein MB27_01810 [Actinoplanes utahensis]
MNQDWAERDGNGHYWPGQPPLIPASFYPTPADPLVSPNYEGWWRRSVTLAARIWKPSLVLHAILVLPTLALTVPADAYFTAENERLQATAVRGATTAGFAPLVELFQAYLVLLAALLASALVSAIATAIAVRLVVLAATGQPVSLRAAAGYGLRRTHAVLGWGLLGGLLTGASVLLCVLPVFYVAAVLTVLTVVVTLEPGSGIGRCFAIFHADFGTSVARVATIFGITVAAAVGLGLAGAVLTTALGTTGGLAVATLMDGAFTLAAGIILPPMLVTAYADMRARLEPFSTAYLAPPPH